MTDIFDATILCKHCQTKMQKTLVEQNGMELRAVQCPSCGERIVHPADMNVHEHFNSLKGKTFFVKLRMVGNSHVMSIPKEIIAFIEEQHKQMRRKMDEMVRLCFEDLDTLRVQFGNGDGDDLEESREMRRWKA